MSSSMSGTIPKGGTAEVAFQPLSYWLVLLWSNQPHRAGESACLPARERRFVGRGDDKIRDFEPFWRHRPGESRPPPALESCLGSNAISQRQLDLLATLDGVEMKVVGKAKTFVNGKPVEMGATVLLRDRDRILIQGVALLAVTRRAQTMFGPAGPHHPFGGADARGMVGESPGMWKLRHGIAFLASTDLHVQIHGESGAGKELVARGIHDGSKRAKGPYIITNAAALPQGLVESLIFGNTRNYPHSGADARTGFVMQADGGTYFLDELGECPDMVQAKLLRLIEAGECPVLGEPKTRIVDVRFICATHNIARVRNDLLGRLRNEIHIPPLRERREDIPLLLRHALRKAAHDSPRAERFVFPGATGALEPKLSSRLVDYLYCQDFERNVRDIEAFVQRALMEAVDEDEVLMLPRSLANVPPSAAAPAASAPAPPKEEKEEPEDEGDDDENDDVEDRRPAPSEEELRAAIAECRGNRAAVARSLGRTRSVIYRGIKKYKIK
jgi:DNA-binding NtrC family response regulator